MSANADLLPFLDALKRIAAPGGDRALWGYDEIADYSKYRRDYIANVIVVQPDFPKPIRVLSDKAHPRYVAREVMEWFEQHR